MVRLGADPEQLNRLAARLNSIGSDLAVLGTTVGAEVGSVDWMGPDADRFRDEWTDHERSLRRVSQTLIDASSHLARQAQEQLAASSGGFGSVAPGAAAAAFLHGGVSGGSMAASVPVAGAARRLLGAADPRQFHHIVTRGGPASALTEWTAPAPGLHQHGGNPFARATQQALGEEGLSWTETLGVEGSRESQGSFERSWSAEGATAGEYGAVDWNARGRVMAGFGGEYSASAGITDDRINAQFEAGVHAGASGMGQIEGNVGFIPYEARGEAVAGAEATAAGDLTIGAEGVEAAAAADAFLGGSADAEGAIGSDRYGSVGGSASAEAGVGAHADFSGTVGWDEVSFGADVGATLGIGSSGGFEVSFSPSGVADEVSGWGESIISDLSDIPLGDVSSKVGDTVGGLGDPADDLLEGAADLGGKAVDTVGKTASKLNPLSW